MQHIKEATNLFKLIIPPFANLYNRMSPLSGCEISKYWALMRVQQYWHINLCWKLLILCGGLHWVGMESPCLYVCTQLFSMQFCKPHL